VRKKLLKIIHFILLGPIHMKVTLKTVQLQEVCDILSRFVSKHSTLPILENIYIKGSGDVIVLRATDMEKYVNVSIEATIE
jgi:DNA polymerase III sliding clamp (beta) subunit (PCNA family)